MTNLKTTYMGIELKNPLVVGANNLTEKIENIKKMEEAGAGAVVYKSLFEEQIELENFQLQEGIDEYDDRHAMMVNVFPDIKHAGPKEHLYNLQKIKEEINIPLIGSLNCINKDIWVDYAKKMEQTGIDGLELNLYSTPSELDEDSASIEKEHFRILSEVKKNINIPVSAKLSFFYTNPLNAITNLDKTGIDAFVIFNRLFQPDIDTGGEKHIQPFNLSNIGDHRLPLRFTGLLYQNIKADICSSSGIFTGKDIVKMLLAGANTIQCVSTLYKHKIGYIKKMVSDLNNWMEEKSYSNLEDFRGKLSNKNISDPYIYQRSQYIDILMNKEPVIKNSYAR
ncbi:MAG: dihydroorotate dehydrogenase-like protein [Actinomycetota bacterium]